MPHRCIHVRQDLHLAPLEYEKLIVFTNRVTTIVNSPNLK